MIYNDDGWDFIKQLGDQSIDAIIIDPPYDAKINLDELKRVCRGNIVMFCKPENQFFVPDEFLFWIKTPSTKNYSQHVGRFVEMFPSSTDPYCELYGEYFCHLAQENNCAETCKGNYLLCPLKGRIATATKTRETAHVGDTVIEISWTGERKNIGIVVGEREFSILVKNGNTYQNVHRQMGICEAFIGPNKHTMKRLRHHWNF